MTRESLILAIETSNPVPRGSAGERSSDSAAGDAGAVALCRESAGAMEPLGVESLQPGSAREDDLMGAIDRLLRRVGRRGRDLGRIAVSIGPGGFTGVRIAVATAKAIGEATGARVVGVPSADGVVRLIDAEVRGRGPVVVCLAWKRADVWRSVYPPGALSGEGRLVALDRLMEGVEGMAALVMDIRLEERLRSQHGLPAGASVLRPRFDPVAVAAASLGMPDADPLALAPLYPREPEAVTKWRELGRGS